MPKLLIILHHCAMLILDIYSPSSCILRSSRSEFQPAPINSDQPHTYILNQKKRCNHAFKGNQKRVVEVREAMNEEEALDLRAAVESEGGFEMGTLGKTANRINIIF
ncbi:hypothetical protein RYX36_020173 [Vicia faba]